MRYLIKIAIAGSLLAGCEPVADDMKNAKPLEYKKVQPASGDDSQSETATEAATRPMARPAGAEDSLATDKESDAPKTTAADEKPKDNKTAAKSGVLGSTVASLGDPSQTGLWLKTPLVKQEQAGSVSYKGKTAKVTLIPIDGPATAGSRMSVQAFQTLGAPLTDLVTLTVSG